MKKFCKSTPQNMPRKPEKIFMHKKINCVRLLVFEKFARNFKLGIAKIKGIVYTISRSKFPATCVMVSHMSHNTYTGLRVRFHGNVRPHHISGRQIPCGSILPTAYTQRVLNGHHTAMWDYQKNNQVGCSFFVSE